LLAADRLTNEGDGHEDFPGRNSVARVPAVYRSGEERLERRFEPVHEVFREVIVGRVTGVKRRGEPAFGADEIREALDPTHERFPRTERGPEHFRSFDAFVDLVLQHGDDEVGSAREMPVERSHAHSRKIRDLLRGRVYTAAREHGLCGLHQCDDIPLRVRALTTRRIESAPRRWSRRPDRLGCHDPPLAKRKTIPYSSGKSFRLVAVYVDGGTYTQYAHVGRTLMQYRNLGRTGIKVSPYALGALMFATQVGNPDPEDSIRIIHKALDAGINLVDTADAYGDSEQVVGRALKGRRDNVVLTTKVSRPMGTDPNQQGASRRWIVTAVENSLRRLQTDHIDVYQIHRPDPDTDIEETLAALTDLVRSGKIRSFGTSNMPASNLVEAHWVAERRGLERFRTEQPPYSILNRSIEREVLPVAQQYGMGILAWGPLGQGMLTGRVRRGQDNDVTRAKFFTAFSDERRLDAVERLIPLAEEAGLSMPHLAMAFAISHPGVTSALLGARTMEQLDDLLAGVDVVLSDDVLDRIDEIVPPGTDIGTLDQAYVPPAIQQTELRRRPLSERSAA